MTQKELNEILEKHRKWLNNEECASGIHFFRTREEAEKY